MTTATTVTTAWQLWLAGPRDKTYWGEHPKVQSVSAYLRGLKNPQYRSLIRAEVKKRLGSHPRGMNTQIREVLHDSIFLVMDQVESRNGGQSNQRIDEMRAALNLVKDDLNFNQE